MKTAKPPTAESLASRRSQPVRQTRTNPPRSSTAGRGPGRDGGGAGGSGSSSHEPQPINIFPGVTHFTDAITALPKELVKHFTLLKEVDAKIHVPQQALFQLIDDALRMPSPNATRSPYDGTLLPAAAVVAASAAPSAASSAPASTNGHASGPSEDALSAVFDRSNLPRRQLFRHVAFEIKEMLIALEEKNHVISTANDALNKQLARIDDIWPHLEQEFSEEAKWGSNSHWAYPEHRAAHRAHNNAQAERSRREGAANLSAAAQQIADEAAARSDARKQAVAARRGQKNGHHDADADGHKADKKTSSKSRKTAAQAETHAAGAVGLGISGATAAGATASKRRKVDKPTTSSAMERSLSGVLGSAASNTRMRTASPRASPAPDGKKRKALPAVGNQAKKTRNAASAASSPVIGAFPDLGSNRMGRSPALPSFASPLLRTVGRFDDISIATGSSIDSVLDAASQAAHKPEGLVNGGPDKTADAKTEAVLTETPADSSSNKTTDKMNEIGVPTNDTDKETEKAPSVKEAASRRPSVTVSAGQPQSSAVPAIESSRPVQTPVPIPEVQTNGGSSEAAEAKEPPVSAVSMAADKPADGADKEAGEPMRVEAVNSPPASIGPAKAEEARAAAAGAGVAKELMPLSTASTGSNGQVSVPAVTPAPIATPVPAAAPTSAPVTTKSGRTSKPSTPSLGSFADVPSRSRPARGEAGSGSHSSASSSAGGNTTKRSHKKGASVSSQAHAQTTAAAVAVAHETASSSNGYSSSGSGTSGTSTRHQRQQKQQQEQQQQQQQQQDEDDGDPLYCYCQQISFGEMIACDAEDCAREWFHLECVGLRVAPKANVKWYCDDCKKRLKVGERKTGR